MYSANGKGAEISKVQWPWLATWIILLALSAFAASLLTMTTHGQRGFFTITLATTLCLLAALFDAWTTRIPNWLTYTAIVVGLVTNVVASICTLQHFDVAQRWLAAPGINESLLGFAVCAVLGVASIFLTRVGGGDIKLLAAVGAILGLTNCGSVLVLALSVAVLYALINLALVGKLNNFLRVMALRFLELLYFRKFQTPTAEEEKPMRASMIPMAVPLALGLILSQILNLHDYFVSTSGAK